MYSRMIALALAPALLLSSGRATAQRAGADTVPAGYRSAAGAAGVSTDAPGRPFWRELGDPTLARLVDEALESSPGVHAAQARIREARGTRSQAAYNLAPTVTSTATVYTAELSAAQLPGVPSSARRQESWDGGVQASYELDVFGRNRNTLRAQTTFVDAAGQELRGVRLALAAEVARAYYDVLAARERLDVATRNAENQRRTLALVDTRLREGRGSAFDTERARAQLNVTLASVPLFQAAASAAENRLATLLGRSAAGAVPDLGETRALPPLPESVRVGSPGRLAGARPDLAASERQVRARTQLLAASRADYLPRFNLVGSAGLNAGSADYLTRDGARRYQAGVVVSWPFLDIGRVGARVSADRARADQARASYSAQLLRAVEEAETSIVVYTQARARVGFLVEASRASERAAELARIRFREGLADFLSVLEAERALLDAQNQLTAARVDAAQALVSLYQATGQGTDLEDAAPETGR